MSKILLKDEELQTKIDSFLSRKNRELQLREANTASSKTIFDFSNDSVTLAY